MRRWKQMLMHALKLATRMNWLLTLAIVALLVIGVCFVYSAALNSPLASMRELYQKQIKWAFGGLLFYFAFSVTDYRALRKLSWWGYAVALLLLVIVLLVGTKVYGARRWLMFFGLGVQPSEIAKLAAIFVLSRRLSRPGGNFRSWRAVFGVLAIVAAPFVLIMLEPDLGTAVILLPVTFAMMFVAGVPYRTLGIMLGIGCVFAGLLLGVLFLPQALGASHDTQIRIMRSVGLSEYHRKRLVVFVDPDADPRGAGWNRRQSEIAVGSGGFSGKGFTQGTQNILGFLPPKVAPTDFIFAVIAEEKGFVGSITVLGLFVLVILCAVHAALVAPDRLGRLLCTGILTTLFCHVFVNIAMTVGLMPITGLPLPLLSYGGSFMVVMMASLGIVQSVYIRSRRSPLVFTQGALWQTG